MISLEINYLVKMPLNLRGVLKKIALNTERQLKVKKNLEVSLAFISEQRISKLNLIYRGQEVVTDVLSFNEVNEIVICFKQAVRQAKENKLILKQEIGFLFSHGLLHLLGYTHENPKKFKQMVTLQEKILKKSLE